MKPVCKTCVNPSCNVRGGDFGKCEDYIQEEQMPSTSSPSVYAVDFDGYLCDEAWPEIGAPHAEIISHFKALRAVGNKLILWTCREGEMLDKAVKWCAERGLYFDAVNENLPERIEEWGTDPRKIGADYYCDDRNLEVHI